MKNYPFVILCHGFFDRIFCFNTQLWVPMNIVSTDCWHGTFPENNMTIGFWYNTKFLHIHIGTPTNRWHGTYLTGRDLCMLLLANRLTRGNWRLVKSTCVGEKHATIVLIKYLVQPPYTKFLSTYMKILLMRHPRTWEGTNVCYITL